MNECLWQHTFLHLGVFKHQGITVFSSQSLGLTDIVLQSPSRKLRRGVRKVAAEVWRNSRSAPPSLFWYSPTVIRVLPTICTIHKYTHAHL